MRLNRLFDTIKFIKEMVLVHTEGGGGNRKTASLVLHLPRQNPHMRSSTPKALNAFFASGNLEPTTPKPLSCSSSNDRQ